jgi:hypothetical protein
VCSPATETKGGGRISRSTVAAGLRRLGLQQGPAAASGSARAAALGRARGSALPFYGGAQLSLPWRAQRWRRPGHTP